MLSCETFDIVKYTFKQKTMCVSSNVTCGSCFAKWTGKAWEDSYKCVLSLKSWSIVLNRKFQLCVEGLCDLDFTLEVCIPITSRLNNSLVTSHDSLVKLSGLVNRKNLPDYIVKKFLKGIPSDWKEITDKWVQYTRQGQKSTFSWELDDSIVSSESTPRSSGRISRSSTLSTLRSEDRDARTKAKALPRKQPGVFRTPQSPRDSALPSSSSNNNHRNQRQNLPASSLGSQSPWLPPDKLRDISKWIYSSSDVIPEPVTDQEIDTENESRNVFLELLERSDCEPPSVASQTSKSTNFADVQSRVRELEGAHQNVNPVVPQSTPVATPRHIQAITDALNFNVSAIANVTNSDVSVQLSECPFEDVFRKPKQSCYINSLRKDIKSVPKTTAANSVPKTHQSRTLLQPNAKNSELPGSQIARMESSGSLRPRRKQSSQRIERWRPVLGVDGNLKIQGYLLFGGDMTAGQILTTNTVVQWGSRKVRTCDGKEFELVGDASGKIPDGLKIKLLRPMNCEEITEILKEFQALKDRSDWGAEYELFYDENKSCGSNSRTFQGQRSEVKAAHQTPLVERRQGTSTKVLNSYERSHTRRTPFSDKLAKTNESTVNSSPRRPQNISRESAVGSERSSSRHTQPLTPANNSPRLSPVRKSARIRRKQLQEDNHNHQIFTKRLRNKSSTPFSSNKSKQQNYCDKPNLNFRYNNTERCSENLKQLGFENVTYKCNQNQMMMPSAGLQADSSNVHFSPSRIKVSYIGKSVKDVAQNSPETGELGTSSLNSSHETLLKRPSRSPVKRPCFPCCQGPEIRAHSHFSHTPSLNVSQSKHVFERIPTQSPVGRPSVLQFMESTHRSSSAPAGTTDRTPVGIANKTLMGIANKTPVGIANQRPVGTTNKTSLRPSNVNSLAKNSQCTPRRASPPKRVPRIVLRRLENRRLSPHKNTVQNRKSPRNSKITSAATNNKSLSGKEKNQIQSTSKKAGEITKKENQSVTNKKKTVAKKEQAVVKKNEQIAIKKKAQTCVKKEQIPAKKKEQTSGKKKDQTSPKKKMQIIAKKKQTVTKKKTPARKHSQSKNKKTKTQGTRKESFKSCETGSDDTEDSASVCSDTSDISVGPSASVIFAMSAESPVSRKAPRTLRERRVRDEKIAKLERRMVAREAIVADDDPMAELIASQKFADVPQEWCSHENFLRQHRKRRRPSSSEGTASPSRSGISEGFGNEDATSSVATPQLLMRHPDPKQVQSYLQRQRALNAKAQRPTRQVKRDKPIMLPTIDYTTPFLESEVSDNSSVSSDEDWVG